MKREFHGCPMLQLGVTGIEEEQEEEQEEDTSGVYR
jgi:hypothetical protein